MERYPAQGYQRGCDVVIINGRVKLRPDNYSGQRVETPIGSKSILNVPRPVKTLNCAERGGEPISD